jgi:hypothetical protein
MFATLSYTRKKRAFSPVSEKKRGGATMHRDAASIALTMGVFGSLWHLEFTLPLEISHLIQASLRFCGVFVSLYVLRDAATDTLFGSLYDLSHAIYK